MMRRAAELLLFPLFVLFGLIAALVAGPPRTQVNRVSSAPPRANPTDTGVAYVAGLSDRGPANTPLEIRNLSQFVQYFGARQTYSQLYDWFDAYFREGGYRAFVGRVVGPAATSGTKNLLDGSAGISLVATAKGPGAWSSNVTVEVTHPTTGFGLIIRENGVIMEQPAEFLTQAEAVTWSQSSNYVNITLGASANIPAVAAAGALSAGSDDRSNIVDAQWAAARTALATINGPGQIVDVGRTSSTGHAALQAAALAKGRVAILDYPDSASDTTIRGTAATDRAATGSDMAAAYAPLLVIPPIPGAVTNRIIPMSALICALCARNDGSGYSPNEPPSGALGRARWATGVSQVAWTDAQRQALNDAGVNVVVDDPVFGVEVMGARTLTNPTTNPEWIWISNARFYTLISAQANLIGAQYAVGKLSPLVVSQFHGALQGMLAQYWPSDLVGADPTDISQAFRVDTSENTPTSLATGELKATLSLVIAGVAEVVTINIVKTNVAEGIAA